ncbi:MAG: tRNA adenosine(34) deaminase TadA [Anaerovoracaceae bacterium]|jgi:tRNA(adenine34) deaminase|nr:tRNA adenosine(34) deaminase TadA [Anaerovoracaceae bacterium]
MEKYMMEALKEAEKARDLGEVPIGCVIVKDQKIIGRGYNRTVIEKDPTAHAEILAIRDAANFLGGWRLLETDLYVTCEPCAMCAGAMVWARVTKVVFGTKDPKAGACGSVVNILQEDGFNHQVEIESGILEEPCKAILQSFFKDIRTRKAEDKLL